MALAAYVVYGVVAYKLLKPGTFACNEADLSEAGVELSRVLWSAPHGRCECRLTRAQGVLRAEVPRVRRHALLPAAPLLPPANSSACLPPRLHHARGACVRPPPPPGLHAPQTAAFLRYDLNGDTYLPALANSLVHVLMYSHYLLSAFGINTWWKKQLTSLQLVQFLIVMAQSVLSLARGRICGFPDWLKARAARMLTPRLTRARAAAHGCVPSEHVAAFRIVLHLQLHGKQGGKEGTPKGGVMGGGGRCCCVLR